ncbi:MAG: NAD(P)-binding domain-containing protein [Crocinitomicaceae bacterium]|nr:NAD(P)-binding domain-containing protein [Crocinitomicaceae bacterium]
MKVGVVGCGTMGSGIAQVAATAGHHVLVYDKNSEQAYKAGEKLKSIMDRLVEKGKKTQEEADAIVSRVKFIDNLASFDECGLVIEAIVENIDIKHIIFKELEDVVPEDCILATNTSSLSVASIGSVLEHPERMVGLHFFNPAPLMPLVEVVPAVQTKAGLAEECKKLMESWGKAPAIVKDTPGFIVNRVARPFYGEALRIYEEGWADFATIDWAMTELGGFKMGPFTLMDYIGNDVNYVVTETVFASFYYDQRYKPSFTQKRHSEAGYLGRKSCRGYYDYSEGAVQPQPNKDEVLGKKIMDRILCMLINEAVDAVFWNIASIEDVDLAMTKGVNYPKGLLKWADEIGLEKVLANLEDLQDKFGEDRYRPSYLMKQMVKEGKTFY